MACPYLPDYPEATWKTCRRYVVFALVVMSKRGRKGTAAGSRVKGLGMNFLTTTKHLAVISPLIILSGCLTSGSVEDPSSVTNPGGGSSNTAPVIFGNPAPAVVVGDEYSFRPTATDGDEDPLTFSIQNMPFWMDFDSDTGRLSGVAELGSEGLYENIRISVSDGSTSVSMPMFNILVDQIALGSATLNWTSPTEYSDGSPLTDLAGFKIYYGNSPSNYTVEIIVPNPGLTTYVVENLPPDTYYFTASAINGNGVESNFSNEVMRVVEAP